MPLAALRFVFALIVIGYASICDVRRRMVSDRVWLVGVPAGLTPTLIDVLAGEISPTALPVSVAAALALGFTLFYMGLYGGADVKALLFIAVTLPAHPEGFNPLLGSALPIPVLTVLCDSALLSLAYPMAVLTLNLSDVLRGLNPLGGVKTSMFGRIILMFTVRRISLEKLRGSLKYFPAEKPMEEDGTVVRRPLYFVRAEADVEGMVEELEAHKEIYQDGVLASPTVPMVTFLALGLALLPAGNLVLWILQLGF